MQRIIESILLACLKFAIRNLAIVSHRKKAQRYRKAREPRVVRGSCMSKVAMLLKQNEACESKWFRDGPLKRC